MSRQTAKTIFLVSALIVVLMLGSCAKESEPAATAGGVGWLLSMEEAVARAEKQDRPIMIDVYADWCGWCKRLDSDTYADDDVIARAGEFVSLKLDADANRSIMSQYGIGGLPTILFIGADGKEIHRVIGYKPPAEFVRDMDTALSSFRGGKGS